MVMIDLESLSVQLREEDFRKNFDWIVCSQIIDAFAGSSLADQISSLKVLANYVADVVPNAQKAGQRVTEVAFLNDSDATLNLYSMVLVDNLLTTDPKSISKESVIFITKKLIHCMDVDIERSLELIDELVELIDERNEPLVEITLKDFQCVYQTIEDQERVDHVAILLKLSACVNNSSDLESDNDAFLSLWSHIDGRILLNLSYGSVQPNEKNIEPILHNYHTLDSQLKPCVLLVIANYITNRERQRQITRWLPENFLYDFFTMYQSFDLSKPWEFQSIILLSKVSSLASCCLEGVVDLFLTKLEPMCIESIIQVRFEIIEIQLDALSKILLPVLFALDTEDEDKIFQFLNRLVSLGDDRLNWVVNRIRFNYLAQECSYPSINRLKEALSVLKLDGSVQSKDLALMSKVLGFYVDDCKENDWFLHAVNECESAMTTDKENQDGNYSIYANNIKYTRAIIDKQG